MQTLELPASVKNRACFNQFLGGLAVDPGFLEQAVAQIQSVGMPAIWAANDKNPPSTFNPSVFAIAAALATQGEKVVMPDAKSGRDMTDDQGVPPYAISKGTAIIPVNGPLSKQTSSLNSLFGGSNTVGMRKALALAMGDDRVERVMFHIDSPGGTVAGTGDLGDDIFAASGKKPIASYIEDMGTSAAYWIASQTGEIFASPYANVGSIGVIWTVYDRSEAAEKAGIKVHAITSSPGKAFAVDGMPITKQQMAKMQAHVDGIYQNFLGAVARGRGVELEAARKMSGDADIYPAPKALQMGLIDAVSTFGTALQQFASSGKARATSFNGSLRMQAVDQAMGLPVPPVEQVISTAVTGSVTAVVGTVTAEPAAFDGEFNSSTSLQPPEESSVTPQPDPAKPDPAAAPPLSLAEITALKEQAAAGAEALKLVKDLQAKQAADATKALDAQRERIMANYGASKERVAACPDKASLDALEAVYAERDARRTGADPKGGSPAPSGEDITAHFAKQDTERVAWLESIALPGVNVKANLGA